ncbi:MAG: aminotransferase class V-fold PLP-dependent enzyme [Bryobacteraceae bacterium]|nr:aminotransferase class V-fold PLP-dependent enzyme [Bryobacteraceae bacterium]
MHRFRQYLERRLTGLSRRDLFRGGGAAAFTTLLGGAAASAAAAPMRFGSEIYSSIGVRPIVNCKGTFTIISGSQSLPEVKRAMEDASRHFVHLDELMDAVGKRLAELTQAPWGMVTAGCAAALTHATAACIAGADPEKLQRLPNLAGLKSEVIMPNYSRNVYDHAVRMLGVRTVTVSNIDECRAAFNDKTAMVMLLAGPNDEGPFGTEAVCRVAHERNVPVIVDAAAEHLVIPIPHLQRGADMVAYSGGKCIRGPQCAGLLLGRKDLLQAAWLHSAPHHAFGRSLKVGKEEIMGMLAAVEAWVKRDHQAEWKRWESWLDEIAAKVKKVDGVTTEVLQPEGLSNRSPRLRIRWDAARLGIFGTEAEKNLIEGDPRIILGGASGDRRWGGDSSITIMPYMMNPGDAAIAGERIRAVLANPPKHDAPRPAGPPAQIAGQWDVKLDFLLGSADHGLVFEQEGDRIVGTHTGDILSGDLRGLVEGNKVYFRSSQRYEGTRLTYDFAGEVSGDSISGTVGLAEYGEARWQAKRHQYGRPGGVVRPVKNV